MHAPFGHLHYPRSITNRLSKSSFKKYLLYSTFMISVNYYRKRICYSVLGNSNGASCIFSFKKKIAWHNSQKNYYLVAYTSTFTPYLFPSTPVQCGRLSGHRHPLHPQSFFSFWLAYIIIVVAVAMPWVQTVLRSSLGTFLPGCVSPHLKESRRRFSENNLPSARWITCDSLHQKWSCPCLPLHITRPNLSVLFAIG